MPVVLEDIPGMPLRMLDTFTAGGVGCTAPAAHVLCKTQTFKYMWQQWSRTGWAHTYVFGPGVMDTTIRLALTCTIVNAEDPVGHPGFIHFLLLLQTQNTA